MSDRDLADFSGRSLGDASGRSVADASGRSVSDFSGREERAIGNQSFPWSFPLWFSDAEPRGLSDTT